MTTLYLYEPPDPGPAWEPFRFARPLAELRAGAWRIRERWALLAGVEVSAVLSDRLAGFVDADAAPVLATRPIPGPALIGASWFAPNGTELGAVAGPGPLVVDGHVVGWYVPRGHEWTGPSDAGQPYPVVGQRLAGTADLLTALEQLLGPDCAAFRGAPGDGVPNGCIVLGDPASVLCYGAEIEPGTVFDTRSGAIVLSRGVLVRAGSRLEGPVFAAPGTMLVGGEYRHLAAGPACRIHGEISSTVFLGYANKSHDGFVGHSVVGQWANLGAGTITSNLKNTYGEVRLDLPTGRVGTGRMNVGTFFGDHAKTAIGTLLGTGTVIATGANVVANPVPKYVTSFAWGPGGAERLDRTAFITYAKRIMPRRAVEVTPALEASLGALYDRATG